MLFCKEKEKEKVKLRIAEEVRRYTKHRRILPIETQKYEQ
jgi:hypothetical protein